MVVVHSKSHPDLLVYSSPREDCLEDPFANDGDSVSSLDVTQYFSKDGGNATADADTVTASSVGQCLWRLMLTTNEINVNSVRENSWAALKDAHPEELSGVSIEQLQEYHQALRSIIILDETIDDRAASFLAEYRGKLVNISPTFIHELRQQSPDKFTAFVADFNDNLAYSLERNSHRGVPAVARTMSADAWKREQQQLEDSLKDALPQQRQQDDPLGIQGSFLKTEYKTIAQPAHVDFTWQMLAEQGSHLWLAFFGLTQEGMILQVWPATNTSSARRGQLVFVPLGKLLILPSDTIHGGGFRTRPIFNGGNDVGNLRYHLYLSTDGHGLPRFVNNTYTQKNDRRRELCDICQNAPGLEHTSNDNVDGGKLDWQSTPSLMDLLLD